MVQDHHIVALLAGFALAIPLSLAIDAIARAIAKRRARRRQVKGSRVAAPAWRARKLTNGSWIVERRK
jgi:Na+(H+)/acetate symporter ActP